MQSEGITEKKGGNEEGKSGGMEKQEGRVWEGKLHNISCSLHVTFTFSVTTVC